MLYTLLFFPLQNAVCFIMLTCLVPVLFTFYIQDVLKLKKNNSGAKGLNRQTLNNSFKRKAMEDLCERPRKLIHKELRSQYFDTLTYRDIRNISSNMHKARFSQLLPFSTDTEGTHEPLSGVQVLTGSTDVAC